MRPKTPPQGAALLPKASAPKAATHSEEVSDGQLHEDAEAVCAGHRVLGQHGAPLVVLGQLRFQGLGVQLEEFHVQPGLVAGLERLAGVGAQGRVRLSTARQAQHEGRVSFGRREGHEERCAVADPIGVGLVSHGVSHLVRAGNVAASGVEVSQRLLQASWVRCYVTGMTRHEQPDQ